jgi:hypothetical protein
MFTIYSYINKPKDGASMSEIKLDNGYKLTRSGAFQAKGVEAALKEIAGNDQTITATELTQAKFSSDAKTAFFAKMLTTQMAGNSFEITESSVSDLEDKMETAWEKEQTQATPAPEPTQTKKETTESSKPEKSSNMITRFFTVKGKSTDDIKIEGLKSMLLLGAIGILGGPAGIIAGVGLGIVLTVGKLIAKEIKDPEPIQKPQISASEEILPLIDDHNKKHGNRFEVKELPRE